MKLARRLEAGVLMFVATSCTRPDAMTPSAPRSEAASDTAEGGPGLPSRDADRRTKLQREQAEEQIDFIAAQKAKAADAEADTEKQRADALAERTKLDSDLEARLAKVDIRLNALRPKLTGAQQRATDLLQLVKAQRVALDKTRVDIFGLPAEDWSKAKSEIEANTKELEGNVDRLVELLR